MTEADLIAGILDREGGYSDDQTDPGNAGGGATNFGITAQSWGRFRQLNRRATREEMRAITRPQAAEFYQGLIADGPFGVVADETLRCQLIDFGVNSGNGTAVRWLQRVLAVPETFLMDAATQAALAAVPAALVNKALVAARLCLFGRLVAARPDLQKFLHGWQVRALGFADFPAS